MPVDTVAEAMAVDAYSRYTSDKPTASEEDVAITTVVVLDNSGIYQTVQQQVGIINYMYMFCKL